MKRVAAFGLLLIFIRKYLLVSKRQLPKLFRLTLTYFFAFNINLVPRTNTSTVRHAELSNRFFELQIMFIYLKQYFLHSIYIQAILRVPRFRLSLHVVTWPKFGNNSS